MRQTHPLLPLTLVPLALLLLLQVASPATAAVIHVPGDQPNIQAGSNAAAAGDTVLVADGTYTGSNNKNLDLQGKAITVRSANGPSGCIIDCQGSGRGFHVHLLETMETVIQGFTIQNGDAAEGGGILCEGSMPFIDGNLIRWCTADNGGGIACIGSDAAYVLGNTITGCSAPAGDGGGIYCREIIQAALYGNQIIGNQALSGGGVASEDGSWLIILGSTIRENVSTYSGGGVFGYRAYLLRNVIEANQAGSVGGGAVFLGNPLVLYNRIRNNVAEQGGGLALLGGTEGILHFNRV
jgi:hypothetical protein